MFTKTSSIPFLAYGEVFSELTPQQAESLQRHEMLLESHSFNCLYTMDKACYLQSADGLCMLVICQDPASQWQEFVVSRVVKIHPHMYFNLLPMGPDARIIIHTPKESCVQTAFLKKPYRRAMIRSSIVIEQLIACFYNVRGQYYQNPESRQRYWELTCIDSGLLETKINGQHYSLHSSECILSCPQDTICLSTGQQGCSYLTIMFVMDKDCPWASRISRQVFAIDSDMRKDLHTFVKKQDTPYFNDLLINSLQHFLLCLLLGPNAAARAASTDVQQKFEKELLDEILLYINENICSPLSVEDLCVKFAMSRSTLQNLFTSHLDTAPKQYISSQKLKKSRLLIKEGKYTVFEVAGMLGYSSLHYFSRKFKNEYGMTPSEYANKLPD